MKNKSKAKGNRIERHVVDVFKNNSIEAKRAWGSNGISIGEHEEVDVVAYINNKKWLFQVKGRHKIAEYLKPNLEVVDAQILKEDRQQALVVLSLDAWIKLASK
jgi:Holliday junction resolvase